MRSVKRETRLQHGLPPALERATIAPYEQGQPGAFFYQRYGHPTQSEAESMLGELDGGHALLFPSGTAAATALVLAFCSPGQTIALAEGCYFGTGVLFQELGAVGTPLRRVRPDRAASGQGGPDLARGPVQPVPDHARPRGRRGPSCAGRRRRHGRDAGVPAAARARRRLRRAQRDQVPGRALGRTARRGRVRARAGREAPARPPLAHGIVAAPDPSWLLLRGLRTLEVRVRRADRVTATEIVRRLAKPIPR